MANWVRINPAPQPDDPYREWATETSFADLFASIVVRRDEDRWLPVILQLAKGVNLAKFASGEGLPAGLREMIRVPEFYSHLPAGAANASYCTAHVKEDVFKELEPKGRLHGVIERTQLGLPLKFPPSFTSWSAIAKGTGPATVVTGVIDDGLPFANHRFRLPNGKTRIEYFWNQDGLPFSPPTGYDYGWELTKNGAGAVDGIDKLLSDNTHGGIVDEEAVYSYADRRDIDYRVPIHKPVAQRASHGALVMDLAAGYDAVDAPADRPIIAVQLPVATTADTSGATLAPYVIEGLHYILAHADALTGKSLPVVVNLSYGYYAGPHDSRSVLEAAIDDLIAARSVVAPLRVVLPSGNSRLARCHARFPVARGAENAQPICWRIIPDDRTPSFMEIWLPSPGGIPAAVQITVTTPTGDRTPNPIGAGQAWAWRDGNDVLCKVIYLNTLVPGRSRHMIFIAVAPTATLHPTRKVAPFGNWQITVENVSTADIPDGDPVQAWIQRDDTPYGYPQRGKQSRFEDKTYERFDDAGRPVDADNASYVKRDGSVSAIGTGNGATVIGGFTRSDWTPADYSAGGPVVRPARAAPSTDGPDALGVSDDSAAHEGLLASGTRSSSIVKISGTSVAAPQFTRWIARELAAGRTGNRQSVFDLARNGTKAPPNARTEANAPAGAPPRPPDRRGGGGRVEFPPRVRLPR